MLKRTLRILLVSVPLLTPLLVPAQLASSTLDVAIHRHQLKIREGLSTNWSGYASLTSLTNPQANSVTFVEGDWTIPTLICNSQTTYSAAWVGIDGYADGTVEQTGTEHDCYQGKPQYSTWYEMYPRSMHFLNLTVNAGDKMHAEVSYQGRSYFKLTLANQTTGKQVSTTQRLFAQRTSAEWVVEAPSSWFGVLPLTNFGTINLSNARATINGHTGVINDPIWQNDEIFMVDNSLNPKATPTSLDSTGTAFSVNWNHQ